MKVYRVGGWVRDKVMGVEPKDTDYVVTGATWQQMVDLGYKPVGDHFPVFIHPETGDEYALARKEKRTGTGYHGFSVDFDPSIKIEDDLGRRDLTINAMAMDEDGKIIDPFRGQQDIKYKVLAHINLDDDPVRVMRLARFRARLGDSWKVLPATMRHMQTMVDEIAACNIERTSREFFRAMVEPHPDLYLRTLDEVGVLDRIYPQIASMKNALESRKWHPEGDALEHTYLVMRNAAIMNRKFPDQGNELKHVINALVHDFGKALTPKSMMPKHHGHEVSGREPAIEFITKNIGGSWAMAKNAIAVQRYHMHLHKLKELKPRTIVKMFYDLKAHHSMDLIKDLARLGWADRHGRMGATEQAKRAEFWSDDLTAMVAAAEKWAHLYKVNPNDKQDLRVENAINRSTKDLMVTEEFREMKARAKNYGH